MRVESKLQLELSEILDTELNMPSFENSPSKG
jgi:hypothetical protein